MHPATVAEEPLRAALGQRLARVVDTLLPRVCVLCGLPATHANLCPPCLAELPRPGPACRTCALSVCLPFDEVCGHCLRHPPPWDRAVAALVYRFPVDRLVHRFKFNRDFASGSLLGHELTAAVREGGERLPDLIAPVPLHRARHGFRSFNQAELLARQVGRALGIAVHGRLLSRPARTRAQSGLGAAERRKNIRGAFSCDGAARECVRHLHVALVDDVMTTGATLDECTKTLLRSGAARVSVWVAARAPAR